MTRRKGPRKLVFGVDRLPEQEAQTAEAWRPLPKADEIAMANAAPEIDRALAAIEKAKRR